MVNQRVARGKHVEQASRGLPAKRGEKFCTGDHNCEAVRLGARCLLCGAIK